MQCIVGWNIGCMRHWHMADWAMRDAMVDLAIAAPMLAAAASFESSNLLLEPGTTGTFGNTRLKGNSTCSCNTSRVCAT